MEFQAYSDARAVNAIKEGTAGGDALRSARRVRLTRSYRADAGEWAGDPQHESRVMVIDDGVPYASSRDVLRLRRHSWLKLIGPSAVGEQSKKEEAVGSGCRQVASARSLTTTQETRQTEKPHD